MERRNVPQSDPKQAWPDRCATRTIGTKEKEKIGGETVHHSTKPKQMYLAHNDGDLDMIEFRRASTLSKQQETRGESFKPETRDGARTP